MRTKPKHMLHKHKIPRALREQVWVKFVGKKYDSNCTIRWCKNTITAFDFHVGHNIPESRGGATNIQNLRPICSRCNVSMGNRYSITQWNAIFDLPPKYPSSLSWMTSCFGRLFPPLYDASLLPKHTEMPDNSLATNADLPPQTVSKWNPIPRKSVTYREAKSPANAPKVQ